MFAWIDDRQCGKKYYFGLLIAGLIRCDRLGRVAGGVGAIAGFRWWPIKAYRPCEALDEAGVAYTRYPLICPLQQTTQETLGCFPH